ncbi:MAG: protein kinase [Deltaproteobacteria bacterium]|nr:protein kinase [Deltaproteobacteria bacterium]
MALILVFVFLAFFQPALFERLEIQIYDAEMNIARQGKGSPGSVILVEIDSKSTEKLGEWPWPRHRLGEMISLLSREGAKVIGLALPLGRKGSTAALEEIRAFREKFDAHSFSKKDEGLRSWVLDNLKQLEESLDADRKLVERISDAGNVILTVSAGDGKGGGKAGKETGMVLPKNFLTDGGVPGSWKERVSVAHLFLPHPELSQAALGLGHSSESFRSGMEGRSHPPFVSFGGSLVPSLPLRIAIAYFGLNPKQSVAEESHIRIRDFSIPLSNGEMLVDFRKPSIPMARHSFADLIQAGKAPPSVKGKAVLIGLNLDGTRTVKTPVAPAMPELDFLGHALGSILARDFIHRPRYLAYLEPMVVLVLGVLALLFFLRVGPWTRLGGMVGLSILVLVIGMVLFSRGLWLKTGYATVCIVAIFLTVTISVLLGEGRTSKESVETNRLLGLSFQSQGLLDLAFDKFRKLPFDQETRDLVYNLGLEYEQRRMINKALAAYEYVNKGGGFRDLDDRIPRLKESDRSSTLGSHARVGEGAVPGDAASVETRKRVGRYEIIHELGKGSMGLVYKALDPKINRLLAIKTIRFSDEFDEDVIHEIKERFFREAEIAGRLSHPSIVIIYDVGEDRDLTYMAMEFLEGDDLEKFISKKKLLPFRRVLDVVGNVADALDFAHKAGVIHRDIKPANIMLLNSGGVKVTDFGIAKAISSSRTKTGVILGTPNYMSPEQIMGQRIDHRSDIFSLGVLFYQLLTGELPFHGDNLSSLLYQITQVKHPPVRNYEPRLPKACEQIIDKALAKNPNERFRSAGELGKLVRLVASKLDQVRKKQVTGGGTVSEA